VEMGRTRILVTGGAGFIGTNLVRYLATQDEFDLRVLDNLSVGLSAERPPPKVEFRRGDFTDETTLFDCLRGADVVVHLAALSGVIESVEDPRPSFEVNVVGSFRLLEAAHRAGVGNVIVASTGGALLREVRPPISEAMAPSPLSPYGASKMAMEGYCSAFAGAYAMACAVLRFSNVYGPVSSHKKSVVATFIKRALSGVPLMVYGDGSQRRDYLYVGDLVRGIEAAIRQPRHGHLSTGLGPADIAAGIDRRLAEGLRPRAARRLSPGPSRRGSFHLVRHLEGGA
jgi:UDP-glucose 4-epimerase